MKIRTCRIEGFGIFNEWTLAGLPDGLTVIYGDNEAGKSTLLAFLRGVLFGFPPRSGGEEQYAPLRGGRFGGSLEIDLPSGIYRVERTSTRRARRFTLLRPDGTQGEDEGELRRLLGGADASLFKSVFAFDLAELSQLQQLSRSEIANSIFSAGIAGGGRPARSVLDVLDKEAQQLLKPKGSAKINELVAEMKQVRAGIERARSASATYPEVLAAESDAGAEIARLKDEIGRHEGQRRRLARLVEYWPVENDRRQLGNQLAGLDVVDDFPPDPHARLASALAALSSAEAAARTANASLSECAAARRKLAPDDRLQAVAPQVSALAEAITLQRERLRQKARNAIAIEGSERDVRSANGNLGPGWTEQAVLSFDRSLPVVETVRGWQQQLDRAASAAAEARRNMLAANDEETRFEQRLAPLESQLQRQRAGTAAEFEPILAAAEALDGRTAADARRALGELRAAEGRLDGLVRSEADARGRLQRALIGSSSDRLKDESVALRRIRTRLGELTLAQSDLRASERLERERAAALSAPATDRAVPRWAHPVAISLSIALLGVGGWRAMVGDLVGAAAAWSAALVVAAAGWLAWRAGRPRASASPAQALLDEARREVAACRERADVIERLIGGEARELSLPEPPALDDVEEELERRREHERWLMEVGRLASEVEEAREHVHAALSRAATALEERVRWIGEAWRASEAARAEERSRLEALVVAEAEASRGWGDWKAARGVDPVLSPDGVIDFFRNIQAASEAIAARESLRRTAAAVDNEIESWEGRAREVLEAAGQALSTDLPSDVIVDRLHHLNGLCASDARARDEAARLDLQIESGQTAVALRDADVARGRSALEGLFGEAAVGDEASFRDRLDVFEQRRDLKRRIESLEDQLVAALGVGSAAEEFRQELATGRLAEWQAELEGVQGALVDLAERHDEAIRRQRDATNERKRIEEASDVADLELKNQALEGDLEAACTRWRVLRLARGLIDETLREFERNRQPAVLAAASSMFERVTAGRYQRVVRDESDERLAVIDRTGARRKLGDLSRGTSDQLYLCMRLGLALEFGRQAEPLPLVMDDVLVNFDGRRARAIAAELVEFARHNQVLLFTCHTFTRDLFAEVSCDVRVEELAIATGDAAWLSRAETGWNLPRLPP